MYLLYSNAVHFISQRQADLIKSSQITYVLQSRTFCFCAHMQNFKLLLQKFEANFEIDELKTIKVLLFLLHFGIMQQE